MALIKCPECGRENVSDSAESCPNCGYRIRKVKQKKERKPIPKWLLVIGVILIVLVVTSGGFIFSMQLSNEEQIQVDLLNSKIVEKESYDLKTDSVSELLNYIKEYDLVMLEYDELNWKQKIRVNDYGKISGGKEDAEKRIEEIEKTEVDEVIKLIDAIGDVSLDSKESIFEAENQYSALSDELKKRVTNAGQIETAKEKYYDMSVDDTISKINNIGKISLSDNTSSQIEIARKAYDDLPIIYRKKVSNYSKLTEKEKQYKVLSDRKFKLLDAESELKKGNLNEAKKLLKKLPNGFSYDGTKVSTLKNKLNKNSKWLSLCGRWKTTSGTMRVTQIWDYNGDEQGWTSKFPKGYNEFNVRCKINDNGSVSVKIEGELPIYTKYSTVEAGLESTNKMISISKKMKSFGSIKVDKHTTVTLSSSGLTFVYKKVSPNEDAYFTYRYETNMSYKKRTKKF